MRIIAGRWRRRTLLAPKGQTTRPTTDRVRESLFQHIEAARLANAFLDLDVLDLFAGSGALGFEALSRGARSVVAVERDRNALSIIAANRSALEAAPYHLIRQPLPQALRSLPNEAFDLCFADPPYAWHLDADFASALATVCRDHALWVYEHQATHQPQPFDDWVAEGTRNYGDTAVTFLRRRPRDPR